MTTTEKHREIAVRMTVVGSYRDAITSALDAAHADGDKAGYERGVRESAEKGVEALGAIPLMDGWQHMGKKVKDAILSLLAPPVPVWQHKPDCPTHFQWEAKIQRWAIPAKVQGMHECICDNWNYCPSCGAPKPETKGS